MGSTCEPWPAGSATEAAGRRRCASTRRGCPRRTSAPRTGLLSRLPERPANEPGTRDAATSAPRSPYEVVAAELRAQILSGSLPPGSLLPSQKEIAATYNVAVGTANRVVGLLEQWGFIAVRRGHRAVVLGTSASAHSEPAAPSDVGSTPAPTDEGQQYWLATLRGPDGTRYPPRLVPGCLADPATFRGHLVNIARIEARDRTDAGEAWVSEFELELAPPTGGAAVVTLRW